MEGHWSRIRNRRFRSKCRDWFLPFRDTLIEHVKVNPRIIRLFLTLAGTGLSLVQPSCRVTTSLLGSYTSQAGEAGAGGQAGGEGAGGPAVQGGSGGTSSGRTGAGGTSAAGASGTVTLPKFGPAVAIPTLYASGYVFTDPSASGDGLELIVMSNLHGNKDLFRVTRTSLSAEFGAPQALTELESDAVDSNPRLSADGLELWFFSDRDRASGSIWSTKRPQIGAAFAPPVIVPGLSTLGASDVSACPNSDSTIAMVAKLIDGETAGYDLYEMRRASSTTSFSTKTALATVNSAEDDYDPWLSPDALTLVFHSNRLGSEDLFFTSRQTVDSAFTSPVAITTLNTTSAEAAASLMPSLKRIWFASNRDGDERIYEAAVVP